MLQVLQDQLERLETRVIPVLLGSQASQEMMVPKEPLVTKVSQDKSARGVQLARRALLGPKVLVVTQDQEETGVLQDLLVLQVHKGYGVCEETLGMQEPQANQATQVSKDLMDRWGQLDPQVIPEHLLKAKLSTKATHMQTLHYVTATSRQNADV